MIPLKMDQNSPKPCRVWKPLGRRATPRFLPTVGWRVGVGNSVDGETGLWSFVEGWVLPARSPESQRSGRSLLSILDNSFNGRRKECTCFQRCWSPFQSPTSQAINTELGFPSESNFSGPEDIPAESTVFWFCFFVVVCNGWSKKLTRLNSFGV